MTDDEKIELINKCIAIDKDVVLILDAQKIKVTPLNIEHDLLFGKYVTCLDTDKMLRKFYLNKIVIVELIA